MIPGLTDHEMPAILAAARDAGARHAGYTLLRLPHGVGDLFTTWLEQQYPEKKDKILSRIRAIRGGALNDNRFGMRMKGDGIFADTVRQIFDVTYKRLGFPGKTKLSTAAFRRPNETPTLLFGEDDH